MCGIVAVLRHRSERTPPSPSVLLALLEGSASRLTTATLSELAGVVAAVADQVNEVDRLLRGTPGILALLSDRSLAVSIDGLVAQATLALADREGGLDREPASPGGLEAVNAAVICLKDALWAVQRDRLSRGRE